MKVHSPLLYLLRVSNARSCLAPSNVNNAILTSWSSSTEALSIGRWYGNGQKTLRVVRQRGAVVAISPIKFLNQSHRFSHIRRQPNALTNPSLLVTIAALSRNEPKCLPWSYLAASLQLATVNAICTWCCETSWSNEERKASGGPLTIRELWEFPPLAATHILGNQELKQ